MKYRKIIFVFLITQLLLALSARAQVQIGGLADFELRKGGSDSSPYVNQTPGENWSIYTPNIRLFISGNISEKWFISSVLQSDYYHHQKLSSPFFSVLNLNWLPVEDSEFTVTLGRFVTPYGPYSERLLSSENPFVHLPLSHASGLPIKKTSGILFYNPNYQVEKGLTMVYQRMYSQGIKASNSLGESGWLRYKLAGTLAPASSHFEFGQHNIPSFTGRMVLQPYVWGEFGVSFSHGPFMLRDNVNAFFSDSDLASFTQTLFGADLKISYLYYTFLISFNQSKWKAPSFVNTNGIANYTTDNTANVTHYSAETMIDLPFLPGSWIGLRYEKLTPEISRSAYTGLPPSGSWTYDRERLETVAGYKLQRNLILKASWLYSTDNGPNLDDNVFSLQLSAGF